MTLWLNTSAARWVSDQLERDPSVGSWAWRVCPECCFVEPQPPRSDDHPAGRHECPRPASEPNTYGGTAVFGVGRQYGPCDPTVRTVPVPRDLDQALWSALRMGGTNAVIEVLSDTAPERVGLPSKLEKHRQLRAARDARSRRR